MQPWYATREAVKAALDYAETARSNTAVDRAAAAGTRQVDRLCNRRGFWPLVATRRFDWPDLSSPTPGRLWLGADRLLTLTSITSGGTSIPTGDVLLYPPDGPPYSRLELDRSTSAAFGGGQTSQQDIAVTGVWGETLDTDPAGALAAAITTTTATSVTLTTGDAVGVGDLLLIGSERVLVTGRAFTPGAGLTVGGAGLTSSTASTALTVAGGTVAVGETLLLGSEKVRVDEVSGATALVRRAWDGSVLAVHTAGETIAPARTLTVARGQAGTTAATHLVSAAVTRTAYPPLVVQLAVAEAVAALQAEGSGWARTAGAGDRQQDVTAGGLEGLRQDVAAEHGRRTGHRAV